MAQVTDLTFQELNDAAIANPNIGVPIFSMSGDTIILDMKSLTGDSFTALNDMGFLKVMYKIRDLARQAQETVNKAVATTSEERLNAFEENDFSHIYDDGYVTVSQQQEFKIPITANIVIGI